MGKAVKCISMKRKFVISCQKTQESSLKVGRGGTQLPMPRYSYFGLTYAHFGLISSRVIGDDSRFFVGGVNGETRLYPQPAAPHQPHPASSSKLTQSIQNGLFPETPIPSTKIKSSPEAFTDVAWKPRNQMNRTLAISLTDGFILRPEICR